jgi:hypothetical protein
LIFLLVKMGGKPGVLMPRSLENKCRLVVEIVILKKLLPRRGALNETPFSGGIASSRH